MCKDGIEMARDVLIIGSGMAGLTAYNMLTKAGLSCLMLEKARGVGGRMSHRRHDLGGYDHGTSFFKVTSPIFKKFLQTYVDQGILDLDGGVAVAKPAGNNLARAMAPKEADFLAQKQVASITEDTGRLQLKDTDGVTYEGRKLLITCPMPQAKTLLQNHWDQSWPDAGQVSYRPVVTIMATMVARGDELGLAKLMGAGNSTNLWEADKPGRQEGHRLVVHFDEDATMPWLQTDLKELAGIMSRRLADAGNQVLDLQAHRWLYAHTKTAMDGGMLAHRDLPIWVAGDGFGLNGVESAFLSAHAAASDMIKKR